MPGCVVSDCFIKPVSSTMDDSRALISSSSFFCPSRRSFMPSASSKPRDSWLGSRPTVNTRPRAQPAIDNRVESFGTGRSCVSASTTAAAGAAEDRLDNAAVNVTTRKVAFMSPAYRHPGVPATRPVRRGVDDGVRGVWTLRRRLETRQRIEFRRPRSPRPNACGQGVVLELDAARCASQHQPAATHVAPADEGCWVSQPRAENWQQHVDILPAGDAAEQHDLRTRTDPLRKGLHVTLERRSVFGVIEADVANRELAQQAEAEGQRGGLQP